MFELFSILMLIFLTVSFIYGIILACIETFGEDDDDGDRPERTEIKG